MKLFLPAWLALASGLAQTGFPFQEETLAYTLNWPSGLSLGDGRMTARRVASGWEFELKLDASLPGILTITDRFRSVEQNSCSVEFEKEAVHGPKKTRETTQFDTAAGMARRATHNGGTSTLAIAACVQDALAFLYYTRRELGQGRVPPPTTIYFGAPYQIRLEYAGAQSYGGAVADRVVAAVKGPASRHAFEILFARDAARTPLSIRVPFPLGTFSMELVR